MTKPKRVMAGDVQTIEAVVPQQPNFIKFQLPGNETGLLLPVSHVSRKILRSIGAKWTAELVKRGKRP